MGCCDRSMVSEAVWRCLPWVLTVVAVQVVISPVFVDLAAYIPAIKYMKYLFPLDGISEKACLAACFFLSFWAGIAIMRKNY